MFLLLMPCHGYCIGEPGNELFQVGQEGRGGAEEGAYHSIIQVSPVTSETIVVGVANRDQVMVRVVRTNSIGCLLQELVYHCPVSIESCTVIYFGKQFE
jgi:hypothetical protein